MPVVREEKYVWPRPFDERKMTWNKPGHLAEVQAKAEALGGWSQLVDAIVASIPHRPVPRQIVIKIRNTD